MPPPPTKQDIIAATGIGQLDHLLLRLPEATAPEVQSLAETMRMAMELGECFHASLSQQFWTLLFQRWLELNPPALAFEAAAPEQRSDHNLKTLVGKSTLHGYWAQVDPDSALESAGDSLLNFAVIKPLQLTAPWRALTLARTLESGPGKTYLGSLEFPENEAQFMEEALERVTGNWLFR